MSSVERLAPSSRNWTPDTPTLSEAVAVTVVDVPATVAPLTGAVIETVGGVVSPAGPDVVAETGLDGADSFVAPS